METNSEYEAFIHWRSYTQTRVLHSLMYFRLRFQIMAPYFILVRLRKYIIHQFTSRYLTIVHFYERIHIYAMGKAYFLFEWNRNFHSTHKYFTEGIIIIVITIIIIIAARILIHTNSCRITPHQCRRWNFWRYMCII